MERSSQRSSEGALRTLLVIYEQVCKNTTSFPGVIYLAVRFFSQPALLAHNPWYWLIKMCQYSPVDEALVPSQYFSPPHCFLTCNWYSAATYLFHYPFLQRISQNPSHEFYLLTLFFLSVYFSSCSALGAFIGSYMRVINSHYLYYYLLSENKTNLKTLYLK